MRFEAVTPAHADMLAMLFEHNSTASITDGFDPFPLSRERGRRLALTVGKDSYYLAVEEESAVGFSMLRGFDAGYAIPSFGIFVDRERHGIGIGRQLTDWTIAQARSRGCPAVRLSVYASNVAAFALYTSLGFRERERETVERDGRSDEKIVMLLELGG